MFPFTDTDFGHDEQAELLARLRELAKVTDPVPPSVESRAHACLRERCASGQPFPPGPSELRQAL